MCAWINKNKPTLFLDGDRMITAEDRLLAPRTDLPPFNRDRLKAINWLFDRSRRQITLTPDGQAFLPHAVGGLSSLRLCLTFGGDGAWC